MLIIEVATLITCLYTATKVKNLKWNIPIIHQFSEESPYSKKKRDNEKFENTDHEDENRQEKTKSNDSWIQTGNDNFSSIIPDPTK
tara:strand:- start:659 stop:916 length:258 start_codon:yes stop_codon:yes gene_type:complete